MGLVIFSCKAYEKYYYLCLIIQAFMLALDLLRSSLEEPTAWIIGFLITGIENGSRNEVHQQRYLFQIAFQALVTERFFFHTPAIGEPLTFTVEPHSHCRAFSHSYFATSRFCFFCKLFFKKDLLTHWKPGVFRLGIFPVFCRKNSYLECRMWSGRLCVGIHERIWNRTFQPLRGCLQANWRLFLPASV